MGEDRDLEGDRVPKGPEVETQRERQIQNERGGEKTQRERQRKTEGQRCREWDTEKTHGGVRLPAGEAKSHKEVTKRHALHLDTHRWT